MTTLKIAAALAALALTISPAAARHHHHKATDANGNFVLGSGVVRSHKTGATAHVSTRYAAKFQAYIDDLEAQGAVVRFMGGYRRGHGSPAHLHPLGMALDVCQLSRGRVDSRCHLPSRGAIARIAEAHGLFEGGQWCNSDYGHVQAIVTASACGTTLMARRHIRHRHHLAMR